MFPAIIIMPYNMTLAPTNEAIRGETHTEKLLAREKNTVIIWVVIKDERIVLLSNKQKIL
jgi:hypothetical protein